MLDIPEHYRSIIEYRTTLGHKVNHKFEDTNAEQETVKHPVFGVIACTVATKEIDVDDEIFINYNSYDLEDAPDWYRALYNK